MAQNPRKPRAPRTPPPEQPQDTETGEGAFAQPVEGEQQALNGVFVQVQYNERGECQVLGCIIQGQTRPSEISDILTMGGLAHRRSFGAE